MRERGNQIKRVIIPYHYVLARLVSCELPRVTNELRRILVPLWNPAQNLKMQVAWANTFRPLGQLVRCANSAQAEA